MGVYNVTLYFNYGILYNMRQTIVIIAIIALTGTIPLFAQTVKKSTPVDKLNNKKTTDVKADEQSTVINKSKTISNTPEKNKKNTQQTATTKQKSDITQDKNPEVEKKKVEWIKNTIHYGIHSDRIDAIKSALTLKEQSNKDDVMKLLNQLMPDETNPEVKRTAITIAGELKSTSSAPWIINSLNDKSEEVRVEAVYAIERLKATEAIPKLVSIVKEQNFTENSNFTEALINTLGKLKATELKDFAIERIKETKTTDNLRQLLVLFLGDLEDISAKDFLLQLLKDKDEDTTIRSYAAVSLSKIGAKDTAKDILEILSEIDNYPLSKRKDYYSLSMYCTASLVKMGDSNSIPRLMEALRSDNPVVRLKAVELIKDLKDKRTVDILKYKMNYDPSPRVQKAAREALKAMGIEVDESK